MMSPALSRGTTTLATWPMKPPDGVTVEELEAWLEPGKRMLLVTSEGGVSEASWVVLV